MNNADKNEEINTALVKGGITVLGAAAGVVAGATTGMPLLMFGSIISGLAAELVGVAMPQRRTERLEKILYWVVANGTGLPIDEIRERMKDPDFVDLLEKGLIKGVNTAEDEVLKRIANLLSHALYENPEKLFINNLMSILADLEDLEVVTFCLIAQSRVPVIHPDQPGKIVGEGITKSDLATLIIRLTGIPHTAESLTENTGFIDSITVPLREKNLIYNNSDSQKASGFFYWHDTTPLGKLLFEYIEYHKNHNEQPEQTEDK